MRTLDDDIAVIQGSFFDVDRNTDIIVSVGREP